MQQPGNPRIRNILGAGRAVFGLAVLVLATGALGACETQERYAACELDVEVTKKGICASSTTGGDTSCVVKSHPHCDIGICLSYFSKKPFCTIPCEKEGDIVCGAGAFCWPYKQDTDASGKTTDEWYCVPSEQKITVRK